MPLTAKPILTTTGSLLLLTIDRPNESQTIYLAPLYLFQEVYTLFYLGTVSTPLTSYLLIRILYHDSATVYDLAVRENGFRFKDSLAQSESDTISDVFFVQKQKGWKVPFAGTVEESEHEIGGEVKVTGWASEMEGKEVQMIMALGEKERERFEGGVAWNSWEIFDERTEESRLR